MYSVVTPPFLVIEAAAVSKFTAWLLPVVPSVLGSLTAQLKYGYSSRRTEGGSPLCLSQHQFCTNAEERPPPAQSGYHTPPPAHPLALTNDPPLAVSVRTAAASWC